MRARQKRSEALELNHTRRYGRFPFLNRVSNTQYYAKSRIKLQKYNAPRENSPSDVGIVQHVQRGLLHENSVQFTPVCEKSANFK